MPYVEDPKRGPNGSRNASLNWANIYAPSWACGQTHKTCVELHPFHLASRR
jgi:hypothetical protein